MQELTNIIERKYIVTVRVVVDRDQVTERPDAVEAIGEAIDNEMHYFNDDLLRGSVRDIIEENLQDIESEINDHQPNVMYTAYRNNRLDVDVDVTESTWYLNELNIESREDSHS